MTVEIVQQDIHKERLTVATLKLSLRCICIYTNTRKVLINPLKIEEHFQYLFETPHKTNKLAKNITSVTAPVSPNSILET